MTAPSGREAADQDDPGSVDRLVLGRQAKLRGLVAARWGEGPERDVHPFVEGAALTEGGTGRAWVLLDDGDPKGLGAALAWATRGRIDDLHVIVETATQPAGAGLVVRRAGYFARPPSVWSVRGRELVAADPGPHPPAAEVPAGALGFVDLLAAHGTDPVVEHGTVSGEVLGLEIVKIVADDAGGWRIDVGVGRHDREARAEMRAGQDPIDALDQVVEDVRTRRRAGAGVHPANLLARERWLRHVVMARPELVGASVLAPLPTARPRTDLRLPVPAPALGLDGEGRTLVAVCSTGVDIDLVPTAVDIRDREAPDARLILVVPAGDDYPITYQLAGALTAPAEVVTVPTGWTAL